MVECNMEGPSLKRSDSASIWRLIRSISENMFPQPKFGTSNILLANISFTSLSFFGDVFLKLTLKTAVLHSQPPKRTGQWFRHTSVVEKRLMHAHCTPYSILFSA
jgi:hypothetical protein